MKKILALLLAVTLLIGLSASALADQTATVKGGWLRMRSAPSFDAETIASYYTGTTLTVLGQNGSWYYVRANDGMTGYMYGSYLTISGSSSGGVTGDTGYITSPNGRGVRLRTTPSVGNNVVGLYNVGTQVKIISRGTTWHYVQIGNTNTVGYMMAQYITDTKSQTPSTPSTGYTAWVYASNGKPVRLRTGPGTGYSIIAAYSVGTQVLVLNHGSTWDQIRIASSGATGYMMNRYLTTSQVSPQPTVVPGIALTGVAVSDTQPTVGEMLYPIVSPSGADYTCQWYNDIGTLLSTGASYQVKTSDRGHALRVVVTGKNGWSGNVSSGYTAAVSTAAPAAQYLTNVTIYGGDDPVVGNTLTAAVLPYEATANFAWYRDTGTLVGTGSTYTLQATDAGYRIYCAATGSGSWSGTVVSASTAVVTTPVVVTPVPQQDQALSGTVSIPNGAVVGTELIPSLALNSWNVDYAWYENGVLISTNATLLLKPEMAGNDIRLVVTAQPGTGYQGSVGSNYCYVQSGVTSPGLITEL